MLVLIKDVKIDKIRVCVNKIIFFYYNKVLSEFIVVFYVFFFIRGILEFWIELWSFVSRVLLELLIFLLLSLCKSYVLKKKLSVSGEFGVYIDECLGMCVVWIGSFDW